MGNDELVELVRTESFYLRFKSPRDKRVLDAMKKVDRAKFVPNRYDTYMDCPVPIGQEQTCSQPSMVAFISDILELKEGMKVLEIGSGCGYHAAVTSQIIGPNGHLTTIEYLPELTNLAQKNLEKQFGDSKRLNVICGDGSIGNPSEQPYDRIYLTAGVIFEKFEPKILADQLNMSEGILIFPERFGALFKQRYKDGKLVEQKKFEGICFVPLKGKNS